MNDNLDRNKESELKQNLAKSYRRADAINFESELFQIEADGFHNILRELTKFAQESELSDEQYQKCIERADYYLAQSAGLTSLLKARADELKGITEIIIRDAKILGIEIANDDEIRKVFQQYEELTSE